jgi:hypothetical protein
MGAEAQHDRGLIAIAAAGRQTNDQRNVDLVKCAALTGR